MRYLLTLVAIVVVGGLLISAAPTPPAKIVFQAKNGNVTFDHAAHLKREKNDCAVCHPKLFPQTKGAPINFKAGMHKPAEAAKTSCGACHHPGGPAFGTAGNCTNSKCHVKGS